MQGSYRNFLLLHVHCITYNYREMPMPSKKKKKKNKYLDTADTVAACVITELSHYRRTDLRTVIRYEHWTL